MAPRAVGASGIGADNDAFGEKASLANERKTVTRKKLFISHVSAEAELARCLKQRLDKDFLGLLDIFVSSDRKTVAAGRNWLDAVDRALRDADMQIVLCSKESVGRPWVNFEAGAAWLRRIPVIPVCHSDMRPVDLPVPLSMLEAIECAQPEGLQQLYEAVADELGLQVPAIDFQQLAGEVRLLEQKFAQAREALERIENPRILCAASAQYAEGDMGFDLDVGVLQKTFPKQLVVESQLTRQRLLELLTSQHFDIVHLVLAIDPRNGDLIFSPIDLDSYQPAGASVDRMSPASFAELLQDSGARLVVLATCKALLLAVEVAHVANMAASDAIITGEAAAEWEQFFYGLLAQGRSLHKAFDLTRSQFSSTPIRSIRHKDVAFGGGAL